MIELAEGIFHFENLLPHVLCDSIISDLRKKSWIKGKHKYVYSYEIGDNISKLEELNTLNLGALNKFLDIYRDLDTNNKIPLMDQSFAFAQKFLHYREGDSFPSHFDSVLEKQSVTIVSYLNDNYEGGVVSYPKHGIKVSPKKGSIIIHPSSFVYPHASSKITKGEKFIGFTGFDLFMKGFGGKNGK